MLTKMLLLLNRDYHSIHGISFYQLIFNIFHKFRLWLIDKLLFIHSSDNELCLAQSLEDKRWYRASAQEKVDQNTYKLMYIDYGNMESVPADRIREMTEEHAFPCITVLCFLDGKHVANSIRIYPNG